MYPQTQTFLVLGVSKSGASSARFLLSRGAQVYAFDDAHGERIEKALENIEAQGGKRVDEEMLQKMPDICDAVVLSPGVAIDHPIAVAFKKKRKAVLGEAELGARYMRAPIVAVTGTNGKTTTVSLLEEIFRAEGIHAEACGNVGTPMLDCIELSEQAIAIAEISSFQLETLNSLRPHIAVVLNITPDHLSRHYNMENYVFLKSKIVKNLTETEFAVLNFDDERVRAFSKKTKANILWISLKDRVRGAYLQNDELWFFNEKIISADELFAGGLHNVQNALACICVAKTMGVSTQSIVTVLSQFRGVKHRIQTIDTVNGVTYVDDSKGTNVDATIKAMEAMKTPTVLLLGGKGKGYDYTPLFEFLKHSKAVHAVLYGENRYELLQCARKAEFFSSTLCERFAFAVRVASLYAKAGQTVLLSPASASFDEFSGYEERGEAFIALVRELQKNAVKEMDTRIDEYKQEETE